MSEKKKESKKNKQKENTEKEKKFNHEDLYAPQEEQFGFEDVVKPADGLESEYGMNEASECAPEEDYNDYEKELDVSETSVGGRGNDQYYARRWLARMSKTTDFSALEKVDQDLLEQLFDVLDNIKD